MNNPNISSITVLPKLQRILLNDIEVLSQMLSGRQAESDLYELIESLKNAKKSIIEMIPAKDDSMSSIPTPPQKAPLTSYSSKSTTEIKDRVKLPSIFFAIEKDQMAFVQRASDSPGIPAGIKSILNKILNKYTAVTDQLQRIKSTQNINPIVV